MALAGKAVWAYALVALFMAGCTDNTVHPQAFERSDTFIVAAESGKWVGFEAATDVRMEVAYEADPSIDILILSEANKQSYESDKPLSAKCSDEAARKGSLRCTMGPGTWYILFDNSGVYGAAQPVGPATVSYSYRVTPLA